VKHLYDEKKVLINSDGQSFQQKQTTIRSYLISIDINKPTTYDAGNPGPGFVQVQQCDVTKPVYILKYKYNI
jgi:hypothetical protein